MKVTLIASTRIEDFSTSVMGTRFDAYSMSSLSLISSADNLAHFAGRACYQSWDMPNPDTSTDQSYLANIIKQQHFSVLEHASATFYVEEVSRNLTHELIRHRHLSFSEMSQRYVNMEDADFVLPPAMRDTQYPEMFGHQYVVSTAKQFYEDALHDLGELGVKGKKAREAARSYLPGAMETKIVVTGNHRAWRDMLHKRYSVHADAEMQELATEILRQLRGIAPATYQDFPDTPFS